MHISRILLIGTTAYSAVLAKRRQRQEQLEKMSKIILKQSDLIVYLTTQLDENEIPMTEFDAIVFKNFEREIEEECS